MAIKGLSRPYLAKYNNNGGTVTYTEGVVGGKAVSYQADVNTTEDNNLYADNAVAETAPGEFINATITLGTDGLDTEASKLIIGLKEVKTTIEGFEEEVTEYVMDRDSKPQEVGYGIIEEHQKNNKTFYRAVVFCRLLFKVPSDAANTRGNNIDWQTSTITGTAIRSAEKNEKIKNPWKKFADFESEELAEKYLKAVLGIKGKVEK